jgi:hypothetical protein
MGLVVITTFQTVFFSVLFFTIAYLTTGFTIGQVALWIWLIALAGYVALQYVYVGWACNDICIQDDRLVITNSHALFKKHVAFSFDNIQQVSLRQSNEDIIEYRFSSGVIQYILSFLTIFLPFGYKWIRITTQQQSFTFYCFGIKNDYYENESSCYEGIDRLLSQQNIQVVWSPFDKEPRLR